MRKVFVTTLAGRNGTVWRVTFDRVTDRAIGSDFTFLEGFGTMDGGFTPIFGVRIIQVFRGLGSRLIDVVFAHIG